MRERLASFTSFLSYSVWSMCCRCGSKAESPGEEALVLAVFHNFFLQPDKCFIAFAVHQWHVDGLIRVTGCWRLVLATAIMLFVYEGGLIIYKKLG
jgi:hypothetical protein